MLKPAVLSPQYPPLGATLLQSQAMLSVINKLNKTICDPKKSTHNVRLTHAERTGMGTKSTKKTPAHLQILQLILWGQDAHFPPPNPAASSLTWDPANTACWGPRGTRREH